MPTPTVKDALYWSIVKIPLKVYGQPAVIHELGSEYHDGDHSSAQGPLLLEDDNRRLRLPTTREDIVSKPSDPYTPLCYRIAFFVLPIAFTLYAFPLENYFIRSKERTIYLNTKGSSIPGGS